MHTLPQPRRPWLAAAMSLVLPGFGQLYNGEANKAIWLFFGFAVLSIPGLSCVALYLPGAYMLPALVIALILTLAIWGYGLLDAWRSARQLEHFQPPGWQISGVYVLVFTLCSLAQWFLVDYVRAHLVQSLYIPSSSMEPGILQGDVLFADMRYNCPDCKAAVQRGDIAIFVYPNDRTRKFIKRVIALPGDAVRIQGHTVWVNAQPITVPEGDAASGTDVSGTDASGSDASGGLVTERLDKRQWQVQWSGIDTQAADTELIVPPGQAYVLGDNRNNSKDSRLFGTVPLSDIVGKAQQIWFSKSTQAQIRWQRLGRVVQ